MRVRVRMALVLAAIAGLSAARTSRAGPCATSSIGTVIILGGLTDEVVDPLAIKRVTIRDCFNNPVEGALVVIDFDNCTDTRLGVTQPHHPGFSCGQLTAVTNAAGIGTFRAAGNGFNFGGNPPGAGAGCARVTVDGISFGNLTVAVPDENGIGGVDVADLAAYAADRFGSYRGRSDFNGDGAITIADLAVFAQFRFSGGSISSPGNICF